MSCVRGTWSTPTTHSQLAAALPGDVCALARISLPAVSPREAACLLGIRVNRTPSVHTCQVEHNRQKDSGA